MTMGLSDFDEVFCVLDLTRRGHVTTEQVQDYDEMLHYGRLGSVQVEAAVTQVCGAKADGKVTRKQFGPLLDELQRRRDLESQVRWDFMALDRTGNHQINVSDALMLFKMTHGERFSSNTWNRFLNSRTDPTSDVNFDEMRLWLCNVPDDATKGKGDEEQKLKELKKKKMDEDFVAINKYQSDESIQTKDKKDYQDKTKRIARRKQQLWDTEGLSALLSDDGVDRGEDVPLRPHAAVTVGDVMDALSHKYDLLRRALGRDMLVKHHGHLTWAAMSEEEQNDALDHLHMSESQLRREGKLHTGWAELCGADTQQGAGVEVSLGPVGADWAAAQKLVQQRVSKMKEAGKTEDGIQAAMRGEFEKNYKAETSGRLLVSLAERHQQECDHFLASLHAAQSKDPRGTQAETVRFYSRLVRQHASAGTDTSYDAAALAVGLGERAQSYGATGYDADRQRQELLARERLHNKQDKPLELPSGRDLSKIKSSNQTELQLAVVREMSLKHLLEQEVLISMLQGMKSESSKAAARQLSSAGRQSKLSGLRNQRNNWRKNSSEYLCNNRDEHWRIMQEGVGVHWVGDCEDRIQRRLVHTDADVSAAILADLQQLQDQEFDGLVATLHAKDERELALLGKLQQTSRSDQLLDNMAAILLGTHTWTDEEKQLVDALEEKYEALRQLCLKHVLLVEHGSVWNRLPESDKEKLLIKKRVEEKKLREDGKVNEITELLKILPKDIGTIRSLLGEDLDEFNKRANIEAEKLQKSQKTGQEAKQEAAKFDEISATNLKTTNLLSDLLPRQQSEQSGVISILRSMPPAATDQHRAMGLVRLRVDRWRVTQEERFDVGALALGLAERVEAAGLVRHRTDVSRQYRLASLRVVTRRQRLEAREPYIKDSDTTRPDKGDVHGWMGALLRELEKNHRSEREELLRVLQDPAMAELYEAAATMATTELTDRLLELGHKRHHLDLEQHDDQQENLSILEEAAAIRVVLRRAEKGKATKDLPVDTIATELLATLQDEQDQQAAQIVNRLGDMTIDEMTTHRHELIRSRRTKALDHAATVLMRYSGTADNDKLVQALEEKYDALKDKLLMESLMKQAGEAEWSKLSEKERQKKLVELKLQMRKLKAEGKEDEALKLLRQGEEEEERLRQLMGDNRADYKRKLKDRLANRHRPGKDNDEEEAKSSTDPLSALDDRFEAEKAALLAKLKGAEDHFVNEKERQLELIRLKREKRKAETEGTLDQIAMIMGLAERQQANLTDKLSSDRHRQEQLARQRLEELKRRRQASRQKVKVNNLIKDGDTVTLQDVIMSLTDEKHDQERHLLVSQLDKCPGSNSDLETERERQEGQRSLHDTWQLTAPEKVEARIQLLQDACFNKYTSRQQSLSQQAGEATVQKDDVSASLLADLQETQDKDAEVCLQSTRDMNKDDLIQKQKEILEEMKVQQSNNVAEVLFAAETSGNNAEQEVVDALEAKYDALRDKILVEALMNQVGENEWNNMNEKMRQQKLMEMKLQERKMRKNNDLEKASEIMGDAIKNHELLESLNGENKAEQEKKLKERLKRRKQRLAEGFSEEECNKLEEEEDKEEAEKKNVLLNLQDNFEQEKARLLSQLQAQKDAASAAREHQHQVALLRRDARRAAMEDRYESAALAITLGKQHQDALVASRGRQEHLARERLEAELKKRRMKKKSDEKLDVELTDDPVKLAEAVSRAVDLKHSAERDTLMDLLKDDALAGRMDAARGRGQEGNDTRMEELAILRENWRRQENGEPERQMEILKEALCLRLLHVEHSQQAEGRPSTMADLQVAVLADLQEAQDREARRVLTDAEKQSPQSLHQLYTSQIHARETYRHDNLAASLLCPKGTSQDAAGGENDEVLRALDEKYDVLRDKLLTEALRRRLGSAEWARLSPEDRELRLVELKVEERRLRREGRADEANALLGDVDTEALRAALGDTREESSALTAKRLRLKRALEEERRARGLTVDDAVLEAMMDAQEGPQHSKKKSVLESLTHHYDSEKAALLSQLSAQTSRGAAERARQGELVRLRRQRVEVAREERAEGAAVLISVCDGRERTLRANLARERDRQRDLAQQRLATLRAGKRAGDAAESERAALDTQIQAEIRRQREEDAKDAERVMAEGPVVLQESVLLHLSHVHATERDVLSQLVTDAADTEKWTETTRKAVALGNKEILSQLSRLSDDRARAVKQNTAASAALEGDALVKVAAQGRAEQYQLLLQATVLRLAAERVSQEALPTPPGRDPGEMSAVGLMADLQQRQDAETRATEGSVGGQDIPALEQMRQAVQRSAVIGSFDNLSHAVFTAPSPAEEDEKSREALNNVLGEMDREFEQEKQALEQKLKEDQQAGKDVDMQAELNKLASSQAARKSAVRHTFVSQRAKSRELAAAKAQLEENRRFEKEVGESLGSTAKNAAEKTAASKKSPKAADTGKKPNALQQRVAARRQQREMSARGRRGGSASSDNSSIRLRDRTPTELSLSRERTALDVTLSDDQKNELYEHLMRQQSVLERKLETEQRRHEEQLKKRIEQMKEKRSSEATELLRMAERQKTTLVKQRTDEQNRQIAATKERVARMRYEKTMTMKERGSAATRQFDEFVTSAEYDGMTQDDKMAAVARKMEDKFKAEHDDGDNDDEEIEGATGGQAEPKKMSAEDKLRLLKERRERRKRRKSKSGASENDG